MNKQLIERIALEEVMGSLLHEHLWLDDRDSTEKPAVIEFATRFLSRIDAERGKEAVAWRFVDDEDGGHVSFQKSPPTKEQIEYLARWNRPKWEPLFLSAPTIPEGWSISRSSKDYDIGQDVLIVKKDGVGGYAARPDDDNIASEILHALASDLIAAPQPPAPCQKCEESEKTLQAIAEHVDWAFIGDLDDVVASRINERNAAIAHFAAERDALQAKVANLELYLGNLLARIHRDGGHYQAEHGNLKAVRAADIIVAKLNAQFDEQSVLIERCRRVLKVAKVYHSLALHKVDVYPKCNMALAAIAAYNKGDSTYVT